MWRVARLVTCQFLSPAPTLPVFICIFVFPAIPPTTVRHAVLTYCVLLVAFWASRGYGHAFVRMYVKRPFLTEIAVSLVGGIALVSRVHWPGVMEYLTFAAGGMALGAWFWTFWDDALFEMTCNLLSRR